MKFTDTSKGPTSWLWNIYKTDGGSRTLQRELTGQNITYTFQEDGKYEVELTAKKGAKSVTTYQTITVNAKATTAPSTKATTATPTPAVKAAAMDEGPIPNPIEVIDEFLRLLLAMLNPAKYSITI